MAVVRLDHVNIQTGNLEVMIDWYGSVLGLTQGPRPDFPFPGAWLYAGKHPVIHLVGMADQNAVGSEATLKLEHFAFAATDLAGFERALDRLGVPRHRIDLKAAALVQYHLRDPDGNHVHVDFEEDEA
ncbi:VOC family protein [Pacificoceanicola onchidii]|uniref:VOC family protein n=1 Tax=Pacificoceanicola onchidii TaxID=2562685 RepID=UPI0010A606C7|nr:VOC family protein [Pacificoceanicola onchidii]